MGNLITYKVMEEPDYQAITACIGNNPKQVRWRDYPDWGTKLLQFHAANTQLYIGAFEDDNLIGCMIAHSDILKIKKKKFNCAVIAITEVSISHRKQGIASEMLENMLGQLTSFDFIFAFLIADRGGKNILNRAGFQKIHKYEHGGKVLDKEKIEDLIDLNPVLKKIALAIVDSNIGEIKPTRGEIREATDADLEQIIPLLNEESDRLDVSGFWTKKYLKQMIDWRYKVFVLSDNGEILGSIISYEEIATLGKDYFTSGLLKEMVFKEGVEAQNKEVLINYMLDYFAKKGIPSVSYPYPKNMAQILKKTGFRELPGDERTVFIKPISEPAQELLNSIEKFRYINVFLIC